MPKTQQRWLIDLKCNANLTVVYLQNEEYTSTRNETQTIFLKQRKEMSCETAHPDAALGWVYASDLDGLPPG